MRPKTEVSRHSGRTNSPNSASSSSPHDAAADQSSPVETAGEFFPGGASIELIADLETGQLRLLFTNGKTSSVASRIEYGGRVYVPINLDARTSRAVRFPYEMSDYGSTTELFGAIRQVFMEYGFLKESALVGTHFAFSSWFPDCLPAAPCLLISGPRPEADLFIQLLACFVRHPLQLVDFNLNSLASLIRIQPTLLIGQEFLSPSKLRLLFSSNNPNSYVPMRDGLANFYSAKAIYQGISFGEDSSANDVLRINLTPLRGKLPILDLKTQEGIAGKFQPMLLNYRVRNIDKVHESAFDFQWLTSGLRITARILGACIADAPELQADLMPWFERQQQAMREHAWLDNRCVAIEVGLAFCHSKKEGSLVHIGKFADDVNTILKSRGHAVTIEPKGVGIILRSLGFSPKRDGEGYAIRLTDKTCRLIHRLAFDFDVASIQDGKPRCKYCHEILEADNSKSAPEAHSGDRSAESELD